MPTFILPKGESSETGNYNELLVRYETKITELIEVDVKCCKQMLVKRERLG